MFYKKAMFEGARSWISLILGIIVATLGIIPLLKQLGVIDFNLPYIPTGIVLEILIVIGGVYLIIDGFQEFNDFLQWASIIVGILIIILGAVPLMNNLGIVTFELSFVPTIIYLIIEIIVGVLLIIGAFML
jgi:hypothetical protein